MGRERIPQETLGGMDRVTCMAPHFIFKIFFTEKNQALAAMIGSTIDGKFDGSG
jgi:hypothetical protein